MKAFRTETALFSLSNYLERNASGSTAVAALQLDFSSAFDRAWHPGILKSLRDKGCPLIYLKLIHNFLSWRITTLTYGGETAIKVSTLSTP